MSTGENEPTMGQSLAEGVVNDTSECAGSDEEPMRFGSIRTRAKLMRAVLSVAERVAASDATVLLQGEPGTGKFEMAKALHGASARSEARLLVVDCCSSSTQELDDEMFGGEGVVLEPRHQVFELARGGTIFIDEIGELSPKLQTKLLRVLERGSPKRNDGTETHPIDARLIVASSRSLRDLVAEQRFRADLYYRLAVIEIEMPPLRERLEDISLLIDQELESAPEAARLTLAKLRTPPFLEKLHQYEWPGNFRELRSHLARCILLEDPSAALHLDEGGEGLSALLAPAIEDSLTLRAAREKMVSKFESDYLRALLGRHGGRIVAAARAADIDRVTLYRLLRKHGLHGS